MECNHRCPVAKALIIGQGILTWAAKETDDGAAKMDPGGALVKEKGTSW